MAHPTIILALSGIYIFQCVSRVQRHCRSHSSLARPKANQVTDGDKMHITNFHIVLSPYTRPPPIPVHTLNTLACKMFALKMCAHHSIANCTFQEQLCKHTTQAEHARLARRVYQKKNNKTTKCVCESQISAFPCGGST